MSGSNAEAGDAALIEAIQQVLPQTQCGQCGHAGCAPYAVAIVHDRAPINRCPPGGTAGIERLAALTARAPLPLDPACGSAAPRGVAVIDEARCIGCTLCIRACPVDAIVGAPRRMHDVIAELCTGCALCLPPCPVDCISMSPQLPDGHAVPAWTAADASDARLRFEARSLRLQRESAENERRLAGLQRLASQRASTAESAPPAPEIAASGDDARKRSVVNAAIERARQKAALRAAAQAGAAPTSASLETSPPPSA
ncbi:electron transport complex subunit RsxB [Derxia lacustris]|uniref:electron transport complex subunit RsxB n=1 Tax=Derxia lacustris TaxID=764842 RepID=UPI000A16FDDA|nr:electron transport complex subunit RsxB [Derxia lacustris]